MYGGSEDPTPLRRSVTVGDLEISLLEAGEGEPVFLLHGWPTSALLWRRVMPAIARHRRVIAVDLPGFGQSSKPLDREYTFDFFADALDGVAEALGVQRFGLAVHDAGGPIGLYWASRRPGDLERLAVLNTLIYPELGLAVRAFLWAARVPGVRHVMTSRWGLQRGLRFGVGDSRRLAPDAVDSITEPFATDDAREALLRTLYHLDVEGFRAIAAWLPAVEVPVQVIYGAKDWILPDIGRTIRRLQRDVPHAWVTTLHDCGHFLQEDRPEEVGEMLAEFFR